MNRNNLRLVIALVAVVSVLGLMPSTSNATFTLKITGAGTTTITDGSAPDETTAPGGENNITLTLFSFEDLKITVSAAVTNFPGSASATIETTSFKVVYSGVGAKTFTLEFLESAFTLPGASGDKAYVMTAADMNVLGGTTTGTTVKVKSIVTQASSADTTTSELSFTGPLGGTPSGVTPDKPFTRTDPTFGLKTFITLDYTGAGTANFSTTSAVSLPAPNSAILALAGLPVIGLIGWFRRRKAQMQQLAPSVA